MNKLKKNIAENETLLLTTTEACKRYSLGVSSIRKLMEESGARVKIGKSVRVNKKILDEYLGL